ncbi:MAG: CPBP family glutamic-type intramembrane protease [Anaerolineaceae bacterium]
MSTNPLLKKSPTKFFVLVYVLTIPFWVLSTMIRAEGLPDNLPITDIGATFIPFIAASILIFKEEKFEGIKRLLARTFDYKRVQHKVWFIPVIFLMPFLDLIAYVVMHFIGLPVPTSWHIPAMTPVIFLAFFFAAAGEELGYTAYAIDPMQDRWGALNACLVMGFIHAIWHYPSMIELGQTLPLMAWGTLFTVGIRILTVWLYNNTGKSVFVAILFHAISNTARSIFPGGRPAFELGNAAIGYSIVVVTALIVVYLWKSKTLSQYRFTDNRFA